MVEGERSERAAARSRWGRAGRPSDGAVRRRAGQVGVGEPSGPGRRRSSGRVGRPARISASRGQAVDGGCRRSGSRRRRPARRARSGRSGRARRACRSRASSDENTAPSEAAASMVITASGRLGSHAATRSPGRRRAPRAPRPGRPRPARSSLPLHSSPVAGLVVADDRRLVARPPGEEVLGHVEVGVGEEPGGRHVVRRARPPRRRDRRRRRTGPRPRPRTRRLLDRPAVQLGVAGLADVVQEPGEVGGLGPGRVGPPERRAAHAGPRVPP